MAAKIGGVLIDVAADVSKLVEGMNKAQQVVDNKTKVIKKSIGLISTAIAAVGGTASIKAIIDNADAIGEQSEALGISSEAWSKYIYTAKFAGVESGTLSAAFSAMTRRTNNFARSGGGAAKTALEELGISAEFARKNFTSADKTFEIITEKLSHVEDGKRKTAIAQDIFSKSASQVVRYANLGAKEIERLGIQAETTGNIITTEFASDAGEANEALDILSTSATGMGNKLVKVLTPALLTATRALEDFFDIQRQQSSFEIKREIIETSNHLKELQEDIDTLSWADKAFGNSEDGKTRSEIRAAKNKLRVLKEQQQEVLKLEKLEKNKNNSLKIDLPEFADIKVAKIKVPKVTGDEYDSHVKAYDDYLTKKTASNKEFETAYKQTTMTNYDYDRSILETKKAEYLQYGENKLEVNKWFFEESRKINEEEIEAFNEDMKVKREASSSWVYGMEDALSDYTNTANDSYAVSKDFFTSSMDQMLDATVAFATGSKVSIKDMTVSIIADLAKIQAKKALAGIVGDLISSINFGGSVSLSGSALTKANIDTGNSISSLGGLTAATTKFANGGIMTSEGPLPLKAYANGGIANSPQLALYGEGSKPEAYVPLPDGRTIPVTMQGNTNASTKVEIIIQNNSSQDISAKKISQMTKTNERGEQITTINAVIDGISRNVNGSRTALKSLLA